MNKDVVYRQNITLITSSSDNKLKQFFYCGYFVKLIVL